MQTERGTSTDSRGGEFSNRGSFHSKCGVCRPAKITESLEGSRPRGSAYLAYTNDETAEDGSPSAS